jgi:hypothetical protein
MEASEKERTLLAVKEMKSILKNANCSEEDIKEVEEIFDVMIATGDEKTKMSKGVFLTAVLPYSQNNPLLKIVAKDVSEMVSLSFDMGYIKSQLDAKKKE